jgi:hypothetical protein
MHIRHLYEKINKHNVYIERFAQKLIHFQLVCVLLTEQLRSQVLPCLAFSQYFINSLDHLALRARMFSLALTNCLTAVSVSFFLHF